MSNWAFSEASPKKLPPPPNNPNMIRVKATVSTEMVRPAERGPLPIKREAWNNSRPIQGHAPRKLNMLKNQHILLIAGGSQKIELYKRSFYMILFARHSFSPIVTHVCFCSGLRICTKNLKKAKYIKWFCSLFSAYEKSAYSPNCRGEPENWIV